MGVTCHTVSGSAPRARFLTSGKPSDRVTRHLALELQDVHATLTSIWARYSDSGGICEAECRRTRMLVISGVTSARWAEQNANDTLDLLAVYSDPTVRPPIPPGDGIPEGCPTNSR
jgi:hypothetical protein